MRTRNIVLAALIGFTAVSAQADVANAEKLVSIYSELAKHDNPEYAGPTAADGKFFFNRKIKLGNGKLMACASCHTSNPADEGKHIVTGKPIRPLSPVVNTKRFDDFEKVESKFTQHCKDIIGSDCTAAEKASYITYLLTEKTPSAKK
ncbi:MAG: DUF1924 domain-containing protein [Methylophilales bacterium]|nr:DUF1924 domain-containing protein [Methylophilales bacterium]